MIVIQKDLKNFSQNRDKSERCNLILGIKLFIK